MKKIVATMASFALVSNLFAFTLSDPITTTTNPVQFVQQSHETMLDSQLVEAKNLLQLSQQLVDLSNSYLNTMTQFNKDYIYAMLRLSDDIGKMADRIGEMADRIVQTEVLIGEMADRIVVVAKDILNYCNQTQQNLLQAQKNFNELLIALK
ncbi:hypothetical protein [Nitratiruptor sp. YY09-18]|uniref:hypothetical protein n=1 Tax=Nitratiruptor sp. YY09-18 TaxID=2724901 RepID=UPI001915CC06|nr:hypothetical protein [Nitratiruptor sp. YY09-18]BCD68833.1 hypothetical protein NitYY0918_C1752 [Nitratiruptor sp. YY09-18]